MKARQISDTQSHKLEKHIKVLQSHKLWDHGHICQISKFVYVCLCFLFTQIQIREFGKYWLQPPFKDALTKMILGTYTPILVVLLICGNNVRVESLVVCKSPGSACRLVTGWPHSVDTGQWQDCAALRTHSAHSRASTSPVPGPAVTPPRHGSRTRLKMFKHCLLSPNLKLGHLSTNLHKRAVWLAKILKN